ncbi:MAG: hypothetical protein AAGE92_00085 [Cyanobacteria bacterium P01_G01_bin.4]
MPDRRAQIRGRFQTPNAAPQNVVFDYDELSNLTILTQSLIGEVLNPRTTSDILATVTPTNYEYIEGDVRRYGADTTGSSSSSAAFQAAFDVAIQANGRVIVPSGSYRIDTQIVVNGDADYEQANDAIIRSYVTGSVDGYDTVGFAFLIDGMSDCNWYGLNLDFENGTAGVVMRCRNQYTRRNNFFGAKFDGGVFNSARFTRSKVAIRVIGNEASSLDAGYFVYFNKWHGPSFASASTFVDLVTGDGDVATRQPNAQFFSMPVMEDYITGFRAEDTDQHKILGGFWQAAAGNTSGTNPSIIQSSGTATATQASHGYETNDIVTIAGANESEYNGAHRVTVTDSNTYTFSVDSGATTPATGTITATLNTVAFRGQSGFTLIQGGIDIPSGGYPYWLYDGSDHTQIYMFENTSVAGVFEDTTDNIFSVNNSRVNGVARFNDRNHDTDSDADIDIFGTGSFAQSGEGSSKLRLWGRQGSTRNLEAYVRDTEAFLMGMIAGTDLVLGAGGEEVLRLDDALDQAVIATGKYLGFTDTQSTVGSAGAASALPATPTGYLPVRVGGTVRVIPYFDAS